MRVNDALVVAPDRRVTVYSGDDEPFDYLYKFVSDGHFALARRKGTLGLLDTGALYVAKFTDDGTAEWFPPARRPTPSAGQYALGLPCARLLREGVLGTRQ